MKTLALVALAGAALAVPAAPDAPTPSAHPYPAHGHAYRLPVAPVVAMRAAQPRPPAPWTVPGNASYAVAKCESGLDPMAKNPTSTASGLFQFLNGTWRWVTGLEAPARAHNVWRQYAAFLDLWDDGNGKQHWQPSRHCWAGTIENWEA